MNPIYEFCREQRVQTYQEVPFFLALAGDSVVTGDYLVDELTGFRWGYAHTFLPGQNHRMLPSEFVASVPNHDCNMIVEHTYGFMYSPATLLDRCQDFRAYDQAIKRGYKVTRGDRPESDEIQRIVVGSGIEHFDGVGCQHCEAEKLIRLIPDMDKDPDKLVWQTVSLDRRVVGFCASWYDVSERKLYPSIRLVEREHRISSRLLLSDLSKHAIALGVSFIDDGSGGINSGLTNFKLSLKPERIQTHVTFYYQDFWGEFLNF